MSEEKTFSPVTRTRDIPPGWLVALLLVALLIWLLFWAAMDYWIPEWKETSQFDMFSAASALFSAFAFVGLIYTILLQRRDLAIQLEELQQTREELKGQKEQLAAQNATLKRQSFETRFFEWLKLHHEIVDAIQYQGLSSNPGTSRAAFSKIFDDLRTRYRHTLVQASPEHIRNQHPSESLESYVHRLHMQAGMTPKDLAVASYDLLFQSIQGHVGHYFRNLYNLTKFVDNSELSDREKRFYTNIIRAQLSSYELALLLYNCVHPVGDKFKPLVEKYGLLKNMDLRLLLTDEVHPKQLFTASAFEGSPQTYPDKS